MQRHGAPALGVGARHSTFGFALGTLSHLRAFWSLRFPKGLAWCCNLLLPAWHVGFGCVTCRSLSGRWHFDLLYVSDGHYVKNRRHRAWNQDNSPEGVIFLHIGTIASQYMSPEMGYFCHGGWTTPAPGSRHFPEGNGGAVISLTFLPAGRIAFDVKTAAASRGQTSDN
jgi:hypothetical protein